MKKFVVFALAAFIALGAAAQDSTKTRTKATPEERAGKVTNKMKEKLALSADQEAKIKAINLEAAQKKDAVKAEAKGNKEELKNKIIVIEKERDAKIKAVLTPDQNVKYDKMKEKGKEKIKARHKNKKQKQEETGEDDTEE